MSKTIRTDYEGREMDIGKSTESLVIPWLDEQFAKIIDVRDEIAWRQKDADVICIESDGTSGTAEIKTCSRIGISGTIFLEVGRLYYHADPDDCFSDGWGFSSKATSGIWYCPPTHTIHAATMRDLRTAAQRYCEDAARSGDNVVLRPAIHPNPRYEPGKQPRKTTWGLVIPNRYLRGIVRDYVLYPRPEKQ